MAFPHSVMNVVGCPYSFSGTALCAQSRTYDSAESSTALKMTFTVTGMGVNGFGRIGRLVTRVRTIKILLMSNFD